MKTKGLSGDLGRTAAKRRRAPHPRGMANLPRTLGTLGAVLLSGVTPASSRHRSRQDGGVTLKVGRHRTLAMRDKLPGGLLDSRVRYQEGSRC